MTMTLAVAALFPSAVHDVGEEEGSGGMRMSVGKIARN
jgi:hypothetical protein